MITLSKVRSTILKKGERIIKVLQYGAKTVAEISPFGDDSNPVENMSALYADTAETGEPVIIGYINTNQLAAVGEKRIFSLKADKTLSAFIWLKNDGTMQIGGDADNAVRYQKLDDSLQAQKVLINIELSKIQAAITTLGGAYAKVDISINASAAKITEIKTL